MARPSTQGRPRRAFVSGWGESHLFLIPPSDSPQPQQLHRRGSRLPPLLSFYCLGYVPPFGYFPTSLPGASPRKFYALAHGTPKFAHFVVRSLRSRNFCHALCCVGHKTCLVRAGSAVVPHLPMASFRFALVSFALGKCF